ncbi:MAG: DUF997 family protein [Acidobacteriota bacterium]|nr:DUF997 family protein [Acidobacteriota bacterium]
MSRYHSKPKKQILIVKKRKFDSKTKFVEDKRVKIARKIFAIAWIYFSFYLLFIIGLAYISGTKPYVWGLPRWVVIGNIVVPIAFVIMLIFVTERFIPDIPLTDDKEKSEGKK